MQKIMQQLKSKGKLILGPIVILGVLLAVSIFNQTQNQGTALVYADDGLFLEASGQVENNTVEISSEASGTLMESLVNEGNRINAGDPIAKIKNSILSNQHEQAILNVKLAQKSLESLEDNLVFIQTQNKTAVEQAENSYFSVKSEYEKIRDGVSEEELIPAREGKNQARLNRDYLKQALADAKDLLDKDKISQSKVDEIEKNYQVAKAQYNAATAQLKFLESNPSDLNLEVARYKMLQAKSGADLAISSGETKVSQIAGEIELARIRLEQVESIVSQTEDELNKLVIHSPLTGTVSNLLVKPGEFVAMGKPIVRISDDGDLTIKTYLSEANIGRIRVGQAVEIRTDSDDTKVFSGIVSMINDQAEFTPKNIQTKEERMNTVFAVKISAKEGDGFIKPGMPVDLRFKLDE